MTSELFNVKSNRTYLTVSALNWQDSCIIDAELATSDESLIREASWRWPSIAEPGNTTTLKAGDRTVIYSAPDKSCFNCQHLKTWCDVATRVECWECSLSWEECGSPEYDEDEEAACFDDDEAQAELYARDCPKYRYFDHATLRK